MHLPTKIFNLAAATALALAAFGSGGVALATDAIGPSKPPTPPAKGTPPAKPNRAAKWAGSLNQVQASDIDIEEMKTPATYVVTLVDPPLANYDGGTRNIPATAPAATGEGKLNMNSPSAKSYMAYLGAQQKAAVASMQRLFKRELKVSHNYYAVLNGFATRMTGAEAQTARALKGVASVRKSTISYPDTDAGPEWIGAPSIWDGSATGSEPATMGEGIVVGVLDTGINYDHPSFAAVGGDSYTVTNPLGDGVYLGECVSTPSQCTSKLIGIYDMTGEDVFNDDDGHGSHTASTAAGNVVYNAVIETPQGSFTATKISGVAPHANVIMYRVCSGGCPGDAILAAIDQATMDAVDVINYSIGSTSPRDPWASDDDLAFLNARNAGVFVSHSAGNSGPNPSTVGAPGGPWMLHVAANRHNRSYATYVSGMTGGGTTPPADIRGEALAGGVGLSPIVYAGAAPYNDALCASATPDGAFTGKIVVCDRGTIGRVQKGANVKARGAVGMVLAEVQATPVPANIGGITADAHVLPASHIGYSDGVTLKAWLASASGNAATGSETMASITPSMAERQINSAYADIVAAFSSRGPNAILGDVIVPSIIGPGVSIWAAYRDPEQYNMIQGTSMSSPHLAGSAALVRAAHPEWTPAQVQSALQLTALYTNQFKQDGVTPADPFDMGNGRVDLTAAAEAGFVMHETGANFVAADPSAGGNPTKLNLASMANSRCLAQCSWTRTISSTRSTPTSWSVTTSSSPSFTIATSASTINLPAYGSATIVVTVSTGTALAGQWYFGRVMFNETVAASSALAPDVAPPASMPIAIKPVDSVVPTLVNIVTPRNSGSATADVATQALTQFTANMAGLAKAKVYNGALMEDPDNSNPIDDLSKVMIIPTFVPPNSARFYNEIIASTSPDLDMFVYRDKNGDALPQTNELVGTSASGSWDESVNMMSPPAGYYMTVIQNWNDSSPGATDTFKVDVAVVPSSNAGNMTVSAPASVTPGVPYSLTFKYNLPLGANWDDYYGVATLGTSPATPNDIGIIPVNLKRRGDDVAKSASKAVAAVGETVMYSLTIKNASDTPFTFKLTDTLPAGTTYVPGSVSGPGASYDAGLNAILVSGSAAATAKGDYVVEDNIADPSLGDFSPFGGYTDLRSFGFSTTSFGDDVSGNFNTLGCNFNFWDAVGGSPTRLGFSSNGLFFPRGTQLSGGNSASPFNTAVPSVITPNNFIAAFWDDLVVSSTVTYPESGYVAATAGACASPAGRAGILQIQDAWRYDNPDENLTYQLQFDSLFPEDYWILYDTMSSGLNTGAIGAEDETGTKGVQYQRNGDPAGKTLTAGRVLHYYRPVVPAPPTIVTYMVHVDAVPLNTQDIIYNNASYTLNVPDTVEMLSSTAMVRRAEAPASMSLMPLWQPIVANGLDATVIQNTVKDSLNAPVPMKEVAYTTGRLVAALRGDSEVPPNASAASGKAWFVMSPTGNPNLVDVTYNVQVSNIVSITAAHIHAAMAGANGSVVHWLYAGGTPFDSTHPLTGTMRITVQDAMVLLSRGAYVNVHTAAYPAGEIRGQIGEEQFNASLASSNEVPPPSEIAWGNALFTYDPMTRKLTYRVDVGSDTSATALHIHQGAAGVNGPVLYNLIANAVPGYDVLSPGHSVLGAVTLTAEHETMLFNGGLYVNVHTASSPGGAMRGQIGQLMSATGPDGMGYMPVASTMSGALPIYALASPDVRASTSVQFDAMTEATRYHITPLRLPPPTSLMQGAQRAFEQEDLVVPSLDAPTK